MAKRNRQRRENRRVAQAAPSISAPRPTAGASTRTKNDRQSLVKKIGVVKFTNPKKRTSNKSGSAAGSIVKDLHTIHTERVERMFQGATERDGPKKTALNLFNSQASRLSENPREWRTCKERPETNKKTGGSGAKKGFIPWCR